jgi:Ni/Co efflux regulator RcnB
MKKLLSFAVLSLLLAGGYAHAQAKDDKNMEEKMHKGGKQQEKMKHCNAEAKGMKGEERKMKMSECLKGQ